MNAILVENNLITKYILNMHTQRQCVGLVISSNKC